MSDRYRLRCHARQVSDWDPGLQERSVSASQIFTDLNNSVQHCSIIEFWAGTVSRSHVRDRCAAAVAAVLPRSVEVRRERENGQTVRFRLNGAPIEAMWLGEGRLRQARELIAAREGRPDLVVARLMSPGARSAFSDAGIGWIDETGAAEVTLDSLIVSKSGRAVKPLPKPPRWTPAVVAVAEALLCGGKATVASMQEVTGLSAGSCTNALRTLTELGLLSAQARRGRNSMRQVQDPDTLLDEYARAAESLASTTATAAAVFWRDPLVGVREIGRLWDRAGVSWAVTGALAAEVIAPYLTTVTTAEVYVDRYTIAGLESVADAAGLRAIPGGRLTLRPYPPSLQRLSTTVKRGLRLAPWPRVYSDLRLFGVRGEDAAEHLREVLRARSTI